MQGKKHLQELLGLLLSEIDFGLSGSFVDMFSFASIFWFNCAESLGSVSCFVCGISSEFNICCGCVSFSGIIDACGFVLLSAFINLSGTVKLTGSTWVSEASGCETLGDSDMLSEICSDGAEETMFSAESESS